MAAEDSLEVVARLSRALSEGDRAAILAELDPQVEVDDQDIIDAGDYRGHDAFFRWQAVWNESWESWRVEGVEFLPGDDDQVVSLFLMVVTGRGSGIEIARRDAIVSRVRDGKVVKVGYYNDQRRALEAAGLDPAAAQPPA